MLIGGFRGAGWWILLSLDRARLADFPSFQYCISIQILEFYHVIFSKKWIISQIVWLFFCFLNCWDTKALLIINNNSRFTANETRNKLWQCDKPLRTVSSLFTMDLFIFFNSMATFWCFLIMSFCASGCAPLIHTASPWLKEKPHAWTKTMQTSTISLFKYRFHIELSWISFVEMKHWITGSLYVSCLLQWETPLTMLPLIPLIVHYHFD